MIGNLTRAQRGWILAFVHAALALSVAGKFLYDRQTLPRVWVRTVPYDPELPLRGRYVRMYPEVVYDGAREDNYLTHISLVIDGGRLRAIDDPDGERTLVRASGAYRLSTALAYFIPEGASDPSRRAANEELWVEVSVPEEGLPRPVRLGVRTDGGEVVPLQIP